MVVHELPKLATGVRFPSLAPNISSGGHVKSTHLKTILSLVILMSIFAGDLYAVNWTRDFKGALKRSSAEGKPILVDFYTDWCGWCKRMDKDTYGDKTVNRLSSFFVCVKVDGERQTGLVRRYKVRAYPTTLFLNDKGAVIKSVRGYVGPDRFREIMKSVSKGYKPAGKRRWGKKAPKIPHVSQFTLSGIIHDDVAPKAIIDNNIVGVGGSVGGAKVIKIGRDEVTMSYQGREIILRIE